MNRGMSKLNETETETEPDIVNVTWKPDIEYGCGQ